MITPDWLCCVIGKNAKGKASGVGTSAITILVKSGNHFFAWNIFNAACPKIIFGIVNVFRSCKARAFHKINRIIDPFGYIGFEIKFALIGP